MEPALRIEAGAAAERRRAFRGCLAFAFHLGRTAADGFDFDSVDHQRFVLGNEAEAALV
ncbi:hypothetical protein D3C72_2246770 [compost metagenome]